MNKTHRYRERMKAEGRCPHCGEPCAPYYECEDRRAYKNAQSRARRRGLGPVVSRGGGWVAANSNEVVPAYTSAAADARREARRGKPRHRPTSLKPWDEMTEDEMTLELIGILSHTPLREAEIEQIIELKRFLHFKRTTDGNPNSTPDERVFARHLVREHLPDCVAMLHRRGLDASQIVAVTRACHATVRYYWLKCQENRQTRSIRGWVWGLDEQGKPRRLYPAPADSGG